MVLLFNFRFTIDYKLNISEVEIEYKIYLIIKCHTDHYTFILIYITALNYLLNVK